MKALELSSWAGGRSQHCTLVDSTYFLIRHRALIKQPTCLVLEAPKKRYSTHKITGERPELFAHMSLSSIFLEDSRTQSYFFCNAMAIHSTGSLVRYIQGSPIIEMFVLSVRRERSSIRGIDSLVWAQLGYFNFRVAMECKESCFPRNLFCALGLSIEIEIIHYSLFKL